MRSVHRLEHIVGELFQIRVEEGDLGGRLFENRIRPFNDGIDHSLERFRPDSKSWRFTHKVPEKDFEAAVTSHESPDEGSRISLCLRVSVVISALVIPYLLAVTVEVAFEFEERVATEFFEGTTGEGERDHGFAGNAGGWDDADIRAFVSCLYGLTSSKIDRFEWPPQGRDRFEISAHDDVFTVGDSALNPAGIVLRTGEASVTRSVLVVFRIAVIADGIVDR